VEGGLLESTDYVAKIQEAALMRESEHANRADYFQFALFRFTASTALVDEQGVSLKVQSQRDRIAFTCMKTHQV